MLRPPCRKKIRVNNTSSAPVTISVTVAAVDSAPLVSFAWLLRIASMAESPAWSICSLLRCGGPVDRASCAGESMLCVTCSTRPGRPVMNWLTTNVRCRRGSRYCSSNTSATAPPRGAPRRSSQSTAGSSSAVSMVASATGTTISSSFAITHSTAMTATSRTSNRQDQAAILRTNGVDRVVRDDGARRHEAGMSPDVTRPVASRGTPRLALNSGADRHRYPELRVPRRAGQGCRHAEGSDRPAASTGGCAGRFSPSLVVVLAVEATLVWDQLAKAWRSLLTANWWWVLAAVAAAMLSMHSFAQIQRTLLKSAGCGRQAVALGGRLLRRQRVEHDAARRPGALGDLHLPPAADCGAPRQWWRPGSW